MQKGDVSDSDNENVNENQQETNEKVGAVYTSEVSNKPTIEKVKKPRSEAQLAAMAKAREKMLENRRVRQEMKTKINEEKNEKEKDRLEMIELVKKQLASEMAKQSELEELKKNKKPKGRPKKEVIKQPKKAYGSVVVENYKKTVEKDVELDYLNTELEKTKKKNNNIKEILNSESDEEPEPIKKSVKSVPPTLPPPTRQTSIMFV